MAEAGKRVVIVGPSDVEAEIETLRGVLDQADRILGGGQLTVWHWQTDGRPGMHVDGGQGLADQQMRVAEADLVIGVFWTRLGTPTLGDESGTAHELRLAVEAWRDHRRPEIFLYFCDRGQSQSDLMGAENFEQFVALRQFRQSLPNEISHSTFDTADDLQAKFNSHLGAWLNEGQPLETLKTDSAGAMAPPDASRAVHRKGQTSAIQKAFSKAAIVCLHGIPGSGKTLLAALYASSGELLAEHQGGALWYDMPQGGTLEEMLAVVPDGLAGPDDLSPTARVKILLGNLRLHRRILVVDDFYKAQPRSFEPLIAIGANQTVPGCLLLLTRSAVVGDADVESIKIRSWSAAEIRTLLTDLLVAPLREDLYDRLRRQTGGLPLAIKFFAVLVKNFGHDPEKLLAGQLAQTELTERWYAEIEAALSPTELGLLRYFSLAEPYVTEPVLRRAQGQLDRAEGTRAFVRLQTLLLVEQRGANRWAVHPFVAEHTLNATSADVLRGLLKDLSDFSWAAIHRLRARDIDHKALIAGIRACQYAQRAGELARAERIITRVASPAKRLGHYRKLKSLCQAQTVARRKGDPWIVYHLAHCELILGNAEAAEAILSGLAPEDRSSALAFTVGRVLAEARAQLGQRQEAIAELRKSLSVTPGPDRSTAAAHSQARGTFAKLLIDDGALVEASEIVGEIARTTHDDRTLAVVMVLLGMIDAVQNPTMADRRFLAAASKFRSVGDRRGLSWALQGLSEVLLKRDGGPKAARRCVREAIMVAARIGAATVEYVEWLKRIHPMFQDDPGTLSLVEHEQARVGVDLEILVRTDS